MNETINERDENKGDKLIGNCENYEEKQANAIDHIETIGEFPF